MSDKFCPVLMTKEGVHACGVDGDGNLYPLDSVACLRDNCAWWDEDVRDCAILGLSATLRYLLAVAEAS